MRKVLFVVALTALVVVMLAVPAGAQSVGADDSVHLSVNGDGSIDSGESYGVVVVVSGSLELTGDATTVVIVDGTLTTQGATVETLVLVRATATLGPDTLVTGDVHSVDSTVTRDPAAVIEGSIETGVSAEIARGFWLLGLLFMIGWAILVLLSGLLMAAVAPTLSRRAGTAITDEIGATIGAGLLSWVLMPIIGGALFVTVVGIPIALAIWFILMPVLGFAGLLVAGIRIGEAVIARDGGHGHPYGASFLGLTALIIVGMIPILGPIILTVAAFLGSGALTLMAIRAARRQPMPVGAEPNSADTAESF